MWKIYQIQIGTAEEVNNRKLIPVNRNLEFSRHQLHHYLHILQLLSEYNSIVIFIYD